MTKDKTVNLYGHVPTAVNPPGDKEVACDKSANCGCARCCLYRLSKDTWGVTEDVYNSFSNK